MCPERSTMRRVKYAQTRYYYAEYNTWTEAFQYDFESEIVRDDAIIAEYIDIKNRYRNECGDDECSSHEGLEYVDISHRVLVYDTGLGVASNWRLLCAFFTTHNATGVSVREFFRSPRHLVDLLSICFDDTAVASRFIDALEQTVSAYGRILNGRTEDIEGFIEATLDADYCRKTTPAHRRRRREREPRVPREPRKEGKTSESSPSDGE